MGLMIISNFISKLNFDAGKYVWFTAILLHVLLLINFLYHILKTRSFDNIIPSYFVPPVGIVVACVSGKIFNYPTLCNAIFIFGFYSYMVTLILVVFRLSKLGHFYKILLILPFFETWPIFATIVDNQRLALGQIALIEVLHSNIA